MKNGIIKFLNSDIFIVAISFIALFSWFLTFMTKQPYFYLGFSIFAIFSLLILKLNTNGFAFAPIIINSMFMIDSKMDNLSQFPYWIAIPVSVIVLSMVFYLIKQRINPFKGKMIKSWSLLILVVFLCFFVGNNTVPEYGGLFLIIPLFYYFLYLFCSSIFKNDKKKYIAKVMFFAGIVVAAEIIIVFLKMFDFDFDKAHPPRFYGGWAHSIICGIYLNMCIAFTLYLFHNSKNIFKSIFFIFIFLVQTIAIILTFSRGAYGIYAVCLVGYFIIVLMNLRKNKFNFFMIIGILLVFIVLIVVFPQLLTEVIDAITLKFTQGIFKDRMPIWNKGLDSWKESFNSLIFGCGFFHDVIMDKDNLIFYAYHNAFVQILCTAGLIGLIAMLYNYLEMIKILIKSKSNYGAFLLIMLIGTIIHSMVDNIFMMPNYVFPIIVIMSSFEFDKVDASNKSIIEEKLQIC